MREAVCPNTDPRSSTFRLSINSLARCPTASFCPFLLPARIAALLEPGRQESFIMHHLERSDWLSRKRLRPKLLFLEVAPGSRPSPYIVLDDNVLLALALHPARDRPRCSTLNDRLPARPTSPAAAPPLSPLRRSATRRPRQLPYLPQQAPTSARPLSHQTTKVRAQDLKMGR